MARIVLQPYRSDASYQAYFGSPPFALFTYAVPLYESLLNHLSRYGVTVQSLAYQAASLSEANITCSLSHIGGAFIRVRLDRFEVTFPRLHETDEGTARQILLGGLKALQEAATYIVFGSHQVSLNASARVADLTYQELMTRYVTPPASIGSVDSGVVFYFRPDEAAGRRWGSIVLDRLAGSEKDLVVKIAASFDGQKVSATGVADSFSQFLESHLGYLDLDLARQATAK
jgi:hypothetical protein